MSFPMQYDWWTYGQETKNHQALKTLQRIYLYSPYYPMYLVLLWNTVYWVQTYLLIRCIKPQSIHSSFIQDVNAYNFVGKISFRSLTAPKYSELKKYYQIMKDCKYIHILHTCGWNFMSIFKSSFIESYFCQLHNVIWTLMLTQSIFDHIWNSLYHDKFMCIINSHYSNLNR